MVPELEFLIRLGFWKAKEIECTNFYDSIFDSFLIIIPSMREETFFLKKFKCENAYGHVLPCNISLLKTSF